MSAARQRRSPFEHVLIFVVRMACASVPFVAVGLVNLGVGGFS